MEDILHKYKKENKKKSFQIIGFALAFAILVNVMLFSTDSGKYLQTSVKNFSQTNNSKNDLFVEKADTENNVLRLKTGVRLEKVSEISFSMLFDADVIKVKDIFSDNKDVNITKISNNPGVIFINLKFNSPKDVRLNEILGKIAYEKLKDQKVQIILAETNFKSGNNTYMLTNTPLEF